jgi:hypothetical protein
MYYTLVHNIWQCAFTNTMNFGTIPPIQVVTVVQIDEPPNTGYLCDNQKENCQKPRTKKICLFTNHKSQYSKVGEFQQHAWKIFID